MNNEGELPMGVSEWINHGKKYGYWDYALAQERRRELRRVYDAVKDMEAAYAKGGGRTLSKGEIVKWLEYELGIGTGRNG
jgi:hypothetical protein